MTMALAMYITTMFLSSWFSAQLRRRVVGYGLVADISIHVILQSMFGGDANGRAGLLLAGVMINITMHVYRHLRGYEVYTMKRGWVRYAGALT